MSEVVSFPICQATTHRFRNVYIRNTVLLYVRRGSKRVDIEQGESVLAKSDDLLIFPSSTFLSIENRVISGSDYQAWGVAYPDDFVQEVFSQPRSAHDDASPIHVQECPAELASLLTDGGVSGGTTSIPEALQRHRLLEPLVWLKTLGVTLSIPLERPLHCQLRDILNEDTAKKWKAKDVSSQLGYSEATFRRKLSGHNTTFSDILMSVRLERALTLLQSTEFPISYVAAECGFSSNSHLTSAFKNRFDISPSKIRKSED